MDTQIAVRAACALVVRADGMVLVIHDFRRGTGLPGGGIEVGESPLECALRELKEETGLDAIHAHPLPLLDDISDTGTRVHTFVVAEWRGDVRSSFEGDVYWAHPSELIGARAAYPEYNLKVLKTYRRTHKLRNAHMIRES